MAVPVPFTSHEGFSHDSIHDLGYDWEHIANPEIALRPPFKVYLPRDTDDVVRAVREVKELGETLRIRSKGHSSNDLVLADGGAVLLTQTMDRILGVDEAAGTVTVQSGTILADLDEWLARRGYGLPVIGDHNHITAGGFASVGGISPASHRYGLFVDNVEEIEWVDWNGNVRTASRTSNLDAMHEVLTGCGQSGVITRLTLRIMAVDKWNSVMRNRLSLFTNPMRFVERTERFIRDPGDAVLERGVWLDYALPGGNHLQFGQLSAYHQTSQDWWKKAVNRVAYGYLHGIGKYAGRLPTTLDVALKYAGMAGVFVAPLYATYKNVEFFTDRILDSSVGDPTRMLIALAPMESYSTLFRSFLEIASRYRREHGCITFISIYVKAIRSAYLSRGDPDKRFCELMLYLGMEPRRMTDELLMRMVSEVDDLCIAHSAFRYMHSKTGKDPEVRRRIDPNAQYRRSANELARSVGSVMEQTPPAP